MERPGVHHLGFSTSNDRRLARIISVNVYRNPRTNPCGWDLRQTCIEAHVAGRAHGDRWHDIARDGGFSALRRRYLGGAIRTVFRCCNDSNRALQPVGCQRLNLPNDGGGNLHHRCGSDWCRSINPRFGGGVLRNTSVDLAKATLPSSPTCCTSTVYKHVEH